MHSPDPHERWRIGQRSHLRSGSRRRPTRYGVRPALHDPAVILGARLIIVCRSDSGVDYYKTFTSRRSGQTAIEADHLERRRVVICNDQRG